MKILIKGAQFAALVIAYFPLIACLAHETVNVAPHGNSQHYLACAQSLLSKRKLSEIENFKIITLNAENLNFYPDVDDPRNKNAALMQKLARSILDLDPDVAVLQEVQNAEAAQRFIETYLNNLYDVHIVPGHGDRQHQIAFLTKKDFPATYELMSNRAETWVDPLDPDNGPVPLFNVDVPVLKIFIETTNGHRLPLVYLAGIHNHSKRSRPGDPGSRMIREAQVKREVLIWNRLAGEMQPIPRLIMAGDFNASRDKDPELDALNKIDALDALEANGLNQRTEHRVTHTYHPKDGPTQASEYDYIFLSRTLQKVVKRSFVYRYRDDETGEELPIPQTFEMRAGNPSNHFPKYLEIRLQDLLQSMSAS